MHQLGGVRENRRTAGVLEDRQEGHGRVPARADAGDVEVPRLPEDRGRALDLRAVRPPEQRLQLGGLPEDVVQEPGRHAIQYGFFPKEGHERVSVFS